MDTVWRIILYVAFWIIALGVLRVFVIHYVDENNKEHSFPFRTPLITTVLIVLANRKRDMHVTRVALFGWGEDR